MEPTAYPLILTVDNRGHYPLYFRSADERAGITSDLTVGVTLYATENYGDVELSLQPASSPQQLPVIAEFGSPTDRNDFARAMADGCEIVAWYTPSQAGLGDKGTTRAGTETTAGRATYKFDVVSVTTFDITTAHGEAAARQAAESIEAYERVSVDANPEAPDVTFDLVCVAPRGKPYLVDADPEPDNGNDTSITDPSIPEPIDGEHRSSLLEELAEAVEALEGDSNDAEHDALRSLAETVAMVLGVEFDPRSPDDDWDENEGEPDTTTG